MDLRTSQDSNTSRGKKSWTKKAALVLAPMLMVGLAVGAGAHFASAAPSALVSMPNSIAPQVAGAKVLGNATGSQHMQIGVSLHSRNEVGLKDYAAQVVTPKAKLYHQYLTPAQFALAFGPGASNLNAVEHFLQGQGLHLDKVASGGLFLQFSGTTDQVESAFHTHINTYRGADGRVFYANANALQLPAAISPAVMDIAGTENARVSHASTVTSTKKNVVHGNVVTCAGSTLSLTTNNVAYSALVGANLESAYGITHAATNGQGVTVAYAEYDGYSATDLAAFQTACGGAASTKVSTVLAGIPAALTPGANAINVETDLEVTMSLLPGISSIKAFEGTNSALGIQTVLSAIANDDSAQVVGYSWGMCEADIGFSNAQAEEQLFMQMALQGQSVFASTGNNGLYACNGDGNVFRQYNFGAQDPASDPFVTAVGGSSLGLASTTGAWKAEQPWNGGAAVGAGAGGISLFWAAPSWQTSNNAVGTALNGTSAYTSVLASMNTSSTAMASRVTPDVSAASDPSQDGFQIYCSVGSACTTPLVTTSVGGTALANAIWVSSAALAVQSANNATPVVGIRLGLISPALYSLYGQDVAGGAFTAAGATTYCDYAKVLGTNAVGPARTAVLVNETEFAVTCTGSAAGDYILQQPTPFTAAVAGPINVVMTSNFAVTPTTPAFQQAAGTAGAPSLAALGNGAGFGVWNTYPAVYVTSAPTTGYNALTGLGSPNVGPLAAGTPALAQYLSAMARVALPRLYMVAQSSTNNAGSYWLGSYATNPYVQNMPTATSWYNIGNTTFNTAPAVVGDEASMGSAPSNLFIFGGNALSPSSLALTVWNIASQSSSTFTVGGALPALGTNCASISAVQTYTLVPRIYCVTSTGALYTGTVTVAEAANVVTGVGAGITWTALTASGIAAAPQVATDNAGNNLFIFQTTGNTNVQYLYNAALGAPALAGALVLSTSCNSTPSAAYSMQSKLFAIACIASDTKNMWANVYSTATSKFNPAWSYLGQPSTSVNFMPGDSVGVDNIATDAGYGQIMYIAEGSDKGMYLSEVNPTQSSYLSKISGWMNVSLPGIFNSFAGTAFESK